MCSRLARMDMLWVGVEMHRRSETTETQNVLHTELAVCVRERESLTEYHCIQSWPSRE